MCMWECGGPGVPENGPGVHLLVIEAHSDRSAVGAYSVAGQAGAGGRGGGWFSVSLLSFTRQSAATIAAEKRRFFPFNLHPPPKKLLPSLLHCIRAKVGALVVVQVQREEPPFFSCDHGR